MKRVAIVLFLMSALAFSVKAQDFGIRTNSGDSLFFKVTDANLHEVEVVPPRQDGPDYYKGHRKVSGVLVIPSDVSYNGQRYRVTSIGDRAFSGCNGIRIVSIPESVTSIGSYAFYGCAGINDPVVIGENITRVGRSAFYGCVQMPAVFFKARRCEYMGGALGTSVFGNCSHLKKVTIGEDVTCIPNYAFSGVDAIDNPLTFPQTLESIGDYAFSFCSRIPGSIEIPDRVKTIGECAFNQCHAITTLTIGAGVDSIGGRAFHKCIGLRTVTLKPTNPPRILPSTFSNLNKTVSFAVPCVSKNLYEKETTWKKLGTFEEYGSCTLEVNAVAESPSEAEVYGGGNYKYGDSVTLVVVCAAGYGFVGWSDGDLENPRIVVVDGDMNISALTQEARTIVKTETIHSVDTVYKEGYKIVHDTVDVFEALQPIDSLSIVAFDAAKKRIEWKLPEGERMLSLMLFNSKGECVYRTDRASGRLRMRRFPSGSYIVRVESERRVANYRFFINNE